MGLFDRPARVRVAVYIEAEQRAEIQRIAKAEDTTASEVHRAALEYGLPELQGAGSRAAPIESKRRAGRQWRGDMTNRVTVLFRHGGCDTGRTGADDPHARG